jgi:Zn-dependent protease/predicted transcriptional regulator
MLGKAWRVARIKGIDINIDPSWLIIFALITFSLGSFYFPKIYPQWSRYIHWIAGLAASILFFLSVLFHELAHSFVATWQGEKVNSITLFIFGGAAQIREEPDSPGKEFLMAIVGPISSIFLAFFFFLVWIIFKNFNQPIAAIGTYLSVINIILAAFNLIPGFPMDGGRVLRSILWKVTRNLKTATLVASTIGRIFALLLIIVGIWQIFTENFIGGLWLIFIGWFLHNAAMVSYRQVVMKGILRKIQAEDLMSRYFEKVPSDLSVEELVDNYLLHGRGHAFLVMDGNDLKGAVCLEDVKEIPREKRGRTAVKEIMTPKEELHSVSSSDTGHKVLSQFGIKDVHQVPVIDNSIVKGIICRSDIIKSLQIRQELGI